MQAFPTNYNFKNLIGQTFGRLRVIGFSGYNKNKATMWDCNCICGGKAVCIGANLTRGNSSSCGCLNQELRTQRKLKHGMFGTKFYSTWNSMISRCYRKKSNSYPDYGGRGITVCERWLKFECFMLDMYPSFLIHIDAFGEKDTSIERKDVNGSYCSENCTWATFSEQARNRRSNRIVEYGGKDMTVVELSEIVGIPLRLITARLDSGWSLEEAITKIDRRFKNGSKEVSKHA